MRGKRVIVDGEKLKVVKEITPLRVFFADNENFRNRCRVKKAGGFLKVF